MARIYTLGWEWGHHAADFAQGNLNVTQASCCVAGAARTGAFGLRKVSTDSVESSGSPLSGAGTVFTTGKRLFYRMYFRKSADVASTQQLFRVGSGFASPFITLQINSSGQIIISAPTTASPIGSPSSALNNNQWYRIEFSYLINTGAADDSAELLIDGTSVASGTGLTIATSGPGSWEWVRPTTASVNWDWDDFAVNDDTGSAPHNTYPGEGNILLAIPVSDSQVGSWTGGAGGTTNLFNALDNTPPLGTGAETDATQIESADSSGDNATDEYRATIESYTTAGLPSGATVNYVQPTVITGEDVSTGSKDISFAVNSNPAIGATASTVNGGAVDVIGNNLAGWYNYFGLVANSPSITPGTSPILAIRKTDTGTRVLSVCAAGIYFDYTVAAGTAYTESATVLVDLQASGSEFPAKEYTDSVTIPTVLTASGTEILEAVDSASVYVDIQTSDTQVFAGIDAATVAVVFAVTAAEAREVTDLATVSMVLSVTSVEAAQFADAAAPYVDLQTTGTETAQYVEAPTVPFLLTPVNADTIQAVESATVPVSLQSSGAEFQEHVILDSATVPIAFTATGSELQEAVDAATPYVDLQASTADTAQLVEAATVPLLLQPSATEAREITDLATVPISVQITSAELAQYVDAATALVDLQASGTEIQEAADTATPYFDLQASGTEILQAIEAPTVPFALTITSAELAGFIEAATVPVSLQISAVEQYVPPLVHNSFTWRYIIVGGQAFQDRSRW